MTAINDMDDFAALDLFFRVVEEALGGRRDYLDPIAVFEAVGWPAAA